MHFLWQKQFVHVCHYKVFSFADYNGILNVNIYRIAVNFDGGKVWQNLTNEACQIVWRAKLWRIELDFVRAGKNKLLHVELQSAREGWELLNFIYLC